MQRTQGWDPEPDKPVVAGQGGKRGAGCFSTFTGSFL